METEFFEINRALKRQVPVVLATVVNSQGSTPRMAGSKMVIYADGKTSGTIGGGAIEGDVIERGLSVFATRTCAIIPYFLRNDGKTNDLDLICGGQMEVMLEFIEVSQENEILYSSVCQKIEKEEPFLLQAAIHEESGTTVVERSIQDISEFKHDKASIVKDSSGEKIFIEPMLPSQTVYIVGGGHVSKEIARLTKQVGLKTLVFDDRKAFANDSRFPEADGVYICPEYNNVFRSFEITRNSYIIIVTRGHSYDKEVLSQALETGAGYIGMMGSRKKRDSIFSRLTTEGCDAEKLDRVHCPIGLPIKAETPAELAVSIVAELINHRRSQNFDD